MPPARSPARRPRSPSPAAAVPEPIFDVHFDTNADGFVLSRTICSAARLNRAYASGNYISTGGFTGGRCAWFSAGSTATRIRTCRGGWQRKFTLAASRLAVNLSFRYRLTGTALSTNRRAQPDAGEPRRRCCVSWQSRRMTTSLSSRWEARRPPDGSLSSSTSGPLAAGTHTLALGGYNNKKTNVERERGRFSSTTASDHPVPVPPSITTQPASLTVTEPGAANFSVVATGDAPLSYQWRRNGVNISGATGASYALNPTAVVRQRCAIQRRRLQCRRHRYQRRGDADGQSGTRAAEHHDAAGEPDGHGARHSQFLGRRRPAMPAQLSVAAQWRDHQRRHQRHLTR